MPSPQEPASATARFSRLPKWAQRHIYELEERVKRAELTIPWTEPGTEWFTLFEPGPEPRTRAPEKLFTCSANGTHCVCTLGPDDFVFIGRGQRYGSPLPVQPLDETVQTLDTTPQT
jgi:hypothetical protein